MESPLFESLWAMQVNFLAADINDLGLDQFLEEHRAYGIGYGLFAVAYFVAAMSIARVAPNPKVRSCLLYTSPSPRD